jgi:hypothetical protein
MNKLIEILENRLTELEGKAETIENLNRRLEVIKTLLTINKIQRNETFSN